MQCPETLVTSAPKVVVPSIGDLLVAGLDEALCLTIRVADMDVPTAFFAREEEKPKFAFSEDGWRQRGSPTCFSP
jgi:hypothetical protein